MLRRPQGERRLPTPPRTTRATWRLGSVSWRRWSRHCRDRGGHRRRRRRARARWSSSATTATTTRSGTSTAPSEELRPASTRSSSPGSPLGEALLGTKPGDKAEDFHRRPRRPTSRHEAVRAVPRCGTAPGSRWSTRSGSRPSAGGCEVPAAHRHRRRGHSPDDRPAPRRTGRSRVTRGLRTSDRCRRRPGQHGASISPRGLAGGVRSAGRRDRRRPRRRDRRSPLEDFPPRTLAAGATDDRRRKSSSRSGDGGSGRGRPRCGPRRRRPRPP